MRPCAISNGFVPYLSGELNRTTHSLVGSQMRLMALCPGESRGIGLFSYLLEAGVTRFMRLHFGVDKSIE